MPTLDVLPGVRMHAADVGRGDETWVLVHGLGGSHLNWASVVDALAVDRRVVVPDLPGFGRSAPGPEGASVEPNLRALASFVDAVSAARPVVLVGNSMGGYLALRLAAWRPDRVRGVVLVNPAAPIPRPWRVDPTVAALFGGAAIPGLAGPMMRRRAAARGPEGAVEDMLKLCTVDVRRIDRDVFDAHVELARDRRAMPWVEGAFVDAARSLLVALAKRGTYARAVDAVRAPTLLVHGARDRLVHVDAARALARRRPDWIYAEHEDLGHVPQLEDPAWFLAQVEGFRRGLAPIG